MLTKTNISVLLVLLFLLVIGVLFVNVSPSYEDRLDIINSMPNINIVEMNIMAIKEYSNESTSIWSDYKKLFKGNYKSIVFTFHKYNIISSLFLIFLPLIALFSFLIFIGVSTSLMLIILSLFSVFTFLPLLLL